MRNHTLTEVDEDAELSLWIPADPTAVPEADPWTVPWAWPAPELVEEDEDDPAVAAPDAPALAC